VTGNGAEGETWYKDPRVSASFFLDQSFYLDWSHLFDRGHLTRRMDPNWGTKEEAERGNADTYHFTNCSPQHFRFNESTKFWQGAEQYVLENGALAEESQNRISVFQGPIFDDKVDPGRMGVDKEFDEWFSKNREALGHKLAEVVTPRTELLTDRNYRHRRSPEQARDYRCVKSGPRRNLKCSPVTWQTAARWLCATRADRIFAPARGADRARQKSRTAKSTWES